MTITFLQADGVELSAQRFRQGQAATHGGGSGRRLGGRSGFRVDTPSNVLTATSTTWTLGPCAAMIDPAASTHQGMYGWSSDANETGSVTAADATYARKDIVYIQVNDSSAGDGSGALTAEVEYLAGTAAASPVAPALPARSFLVGTITVPVSGGGSPTVVLNPDKYVVAGGRLPIESQAKRDALTPYLGLEILRTDLTQVGSSGTVERYNGTGWDHFGHSEYTTISNGVTAGTVSLGAFTQVTGKTTDTGFITIVANGGVRADKAGVYTIDVVQKMSTGASGRAFVTIEDNAGASSNIPFGRNNFSGGEDVASMSVTLAMTAGQVVYPKLYQTTGTVNISGVVRVKRVP
ncbi:hypothetical protein ACLKOZ_17110 [Arthrobacter sp. R4]|uniref:hypothetical protein n=1 Tax=Arthrobacter sp. R4 TaxID=644417 RepID=UPI003ED97811